MFALIKSEVLMKQTLKPLLDNLFKFINRLLLNITSIHFLSEEHAFNRL